MSSFSEASDFIKRQAKLHEGFVTAAAMLDQIGSVKQAAEEAKTDMDKSVTARNKARADLKTVEAKIEAANADAADITIKAANEAQTKAAEITAKAESDAKGWMKQADEYKEKVSAEWVAEVKSAKSKADKINAAAAKVEADTAKAVAELDLIQKEHDKLAKAIDSMKAKFS